MPAIAELIVRVKVIAVAVSDPQRANRFYKETLGLRYHEINSQQAGYQLGELSLILKDDWYGKPTAEPNPRVTIEVENASAFEKALCERGVAISDPVQIFDEFSVGAFLDSEGNKFWFCSTSLLPATLA